MEMMTDYKPQERRDLEELYIKQNITIYELDQENKNLKEKLSEITMVADDEKQSIEHILELEEENRDLVEKIEKLLWEKIKLEEENQNLKKRIKEHCPTQTLADYRQRFEK